MGAILIWFYRFVSATLAPPILSFLMAKRLRLGKEHKLRWRERYGFSPLARPNGMLLWIHAASVGESMVALTLVEALHRRRPDWNILLTSGTMTSARLIAARLAKLSPQDGQIYFHQFIPYDLPWGCKRFISHWHPDLAIWLESELWPNLVMTAKNQQIPMMLVNARMSSDSFRSWLWARPLIEKLLRQFDAILPQSEIDLIHFNALGAKPQQIGAMGNLKFSATTLPLPIDDDEFNQLQHRLSGEKIWLAASTHEPEEMMAVAIHVALLDRHPGLITIIVPRHPHRGAAIEATYLEEFSSFDTAELFSQLTDATATANPAAPPVNTSYDQPAIPMIRRSANDDLSLLQPGCIYLADSLGELGLWYRLAPIAFIGGSLVPHGGQNPLEAARLGLSHINWPQYQQFYCHYRWLSTSQSGDKSSRCRGITGTT